MTNWNDVKYNGIMLTVAGVKGRIYASLRVLFTGQIPLGTTWGEMDDKISAVKNATKKDVKVLSREEIR